jgi:hypothetical protein
MHRSIQLPKKTTILYASKTIPIVNNNALKPVVELDPTFGSNSPPNIFIQQLNNRMDAYYKSPLMDEYISDIATKK